MKPLPAAIKTSLIVLWVFGLLFTIASLATGIVVAALAKGENRAFGFAAVWLALLLVAASVFGTYVLRRLQSAFAVGMLIGIVSMLSQTGLILFATFVGLSKKEDGSLKRSYQAMAAWCFLIFFVYAVFAAIAFAFKDDIIDPSQSGVRYLQKKTAPAPAASATPARATEESKIQDVSAGYNV